MKHYYAISIALLLCAFFLITGCGETINGVGKDVRRVGKGIKTIFVREE